MLHVYCPEMGENEPKEIELTATIGHYGGWYVKTRESLKGRGVKLVDEYDGIKKYKLTDLAFRKLEQQREVKMRQFLD